MNRKTYYYYKNKRNGGLTYLTNQAFSINEGGRFGEWHVRWYPFPSFCLFLGRPRINWLTFEFTLVGRNWPWVREERIHG